MSFDWPDDYTVEKRIGIGKEIPLQALDVIGNISATGDISATNLNLSGSLTLNQNLTVGGDFQLGTLSVNEFSSDGNLAGNSNLAVPTEQAVKTYVDHQINTRAALNGASNQDFATNNLSVDGSLTVGHAIATRQLRVSGSVTGSLTIENDLTVGGSLTTSGVNATGMIQANKFVGDGSQLTNLNRWSLAYAHNANGDRTAGNLNDLINAVQNGSQVRILIDTSNQEYITYAEGIWIKHGIVYLQNISHVSVTFEGDVLKFQDDSYWWMIIVSTKGDRDMIRWNVGEHTPRGHTSDKVAVKWFID